VFPLNVKFPSRIMEKHEEKRQQEEGEGATIAIGR
jgi:hypothetical protein